jgi:hypothetical protein
MNTHCFRKLKLLAGFAAAVVSALYLTACDPLTTSDYYVGNTLDSPIVFHFWGDWPEHDTAITIPPHYSVLVYQHRRIQTYAVDERYEDPVDSLRIETSDTLVLVNEIKWQYTITGKRADEYFLRVDTSIIP